MLHEFLNLNREELISRCRVKVANRGAPKATARELQFGIPVFLDQLAEILRSEDAVSKREVDPLRLWEIPPDAAEVVRVASNHGNELLLKGFTVNQVVHDYGDLCQAVTELAMETKAQITNAEFHTLNRCLDNAIAGAVSEYERERDEHTTATTRAMDGSTIYARQLNLIEMAVTTLDAIKGGNVGIAGATAAALDRSLKVLQDLTAGALADARQKTNGEQPDFQLP